MRLPLHALAGWRHGDFQSLSVPISEIGCRLALTLKMCKSSSAKEKSGKELGKGFRLVHKRPAGRGCGSRSPAGKELRRWRQAESAAADEEAVAFTLGGLQELELLTLFAEHFHIQVAVGFNPILVDFDRQRPNEPQAALLIRKDSNDMSAAFELLIDPLEHIGL